MLLTVGEIGENSSREGRTFTMFHKTVYDILIVQNPVGKVCVQQHEYINWNIVMISDDSV